jgi:hypothetical protein
MSALTDIFTLLIFWVMLFSFIQIIDLLTKINGNLTRIINYETLNGKNSNTHDSQV